MILCCSAQVQEGGSFETAKEKCAARDSTLAQHIQPITQNFLASELARMDLKTQLLWIGLEKDHGHISRTWRWVDGQFIISKQVKLNSGWNSKPSCCCSNWKKNIVTSVQHEDGRMVSIMNFNSSNETWALYH